MHVLARKEITCDRMFYCFHAINPETIRFDRYCIGICSHCVVCWRNNKGSLTWFMVKPFSSSSSFLTGICRFMRRRRAKTAWFESTTAVVAHTHHPRTHSHPLAVCPICCCKRYIFLPSFRNRQLPKKEGFTMESTDSVASSPAPNDDNVFQVEKILAKRKRKVNLRGTFFDTDSFSKSKYFGFYTGNCSLE